MSTQKAVEQQGDKKAGYVTHRALPRERPEYIGVRVKAVALNPTDWKHNDFMNTAGCLCGCDFAGVVEKTGTGYTKSWKTGDRICGFAHGGNSLEKEDGTFAEHIQVKADVQLKIPHSMSDEEASTLGVGFITCGQGLIQQLKLNLPNNPTKHAEPVLIYGGSTATGSLGIQFVKLAGYTPITTCSPRNFDLVKSLGAAAAFNYNDPDCAAQIKKFANNKLNYAWDTISLPASVKICAEALESGGHYASLLAIKDFPRDDIQQGYSIAYTSVGEPVDFRGNRMEGKPEDFEFAKEWAAIVQELLDQGKFKVHPPRVMEGGLEKVLEGLDLLRNDKVSGEKLVYKV